MATAASNVSVTIGLKGQDGASRVLGRAGRQTDKLRGKLNKAGDSAGQFSQRMRALAAGDFRGVVQGLTVSVGGAAVAIAAAGAAAAVAAVKFTQWSIEIERLRAGMDSAFGGDGLRAAIDIATEIGGVGAENVGKLASTLKLTGVQAQFTTRQLQELTSRATAMGKSGDDALQALNRAIFTGTTRSLKLVGTFIESSRVQDEYAKSIGKTTTQLTALDKQQAIAAALMEDLNRATGSTSSAFAAQDKALSDLDNAWLGLKGKMSSAAAEDMALVVQKMADIVRWMDKWSDTLTKAAKIVATPFLVFKRIAGDVVEAVSALFEGRLVDAMESAAKAFGRSVVGPLLVVMEVIDAAGAAAIKTALKVNREVAKTVGKDGPALKLREGGRFGTGPRTIEAGTGKFGQLKSKQFKPVSAGKLPGAAGITDKDKAEEAKRQRKQIQDEIHKEHMSAVNQKLAEMELEKQQDAQRQQFHDQRMARHQAALEATRDQIGAAMQGAQIAGQAASLFIKGEKEKAVIMALVSAAQTAGYIAQAIYGAPNAAAAAVQSGIATVKWALIAGGVGGGSSGAGGATGVGAGQFGATGSGAQPAGGPTQTTVIFGQGFVVGTPAEVGKAVKVAMASTAGTGF